MVDNSAVNVVVVGDADTGKTFFVETFLRDEVPTEETVGSSFQDRSKVITINDEEITLNVTEACGLHE